jgi:hypothetical protein
MVREPARWMDVLTGFGLLAAPVASRHGVGA